MESGGQPPVSSRRFGPEQHPPAPGWARRPILRRRAYLAPACGLSGVATYSGVVTKNGVATLERGRNLIAGS